MEKYAIKLGQSHETNLIWSSGFMALDKDDARSVKSDE